LQPLLVRPVQPVAKMLQRVPLSLELHAEHEQREDEGEDGGVKRALHRWGRSARRFESRQPEFTAKPSLPRLAAA
jgi:hypothetical protein